MFPIPSDEGDTQNHPILPQVCLLSPTDDATYRNFDHWYEGSKVSMATSLLLLQSVKLERAHTSTMCDNLLALILIHPRNGCCMSACN